MELLILLFQAKIRQRGRNMFDLLTEAFIYEYYLYFSILGSFFDSKELFNILSDIFCLKSQDDLFNLLEGETILSIKSEEDYKRYKRIEQYNHLTNYPKMLSSKEETIIALKGKAIIEAKKNQIYSDYNDPESLVLTKLYEGVEKGNVIAMRVFGTLKCTGFLLNKNLEEGIKTLNSTTRWGDFISALSLLKFDSLNQTATLTMLHSIVLKTLNQTIFFNICNAYSLNTTEYNEKTLILKRAFAMDRLNSKIFNPLIAKLVYDSILENKEIEKIIFSQNKDIIYEICELPIALSKNHILIQKDSADFVFKERKSEFDVLICTLKNRDLRAQKAYKPIGLYSDNEDILYLYKKYLLNVLQENHVVEVDVHSLNLNDLEWNKNNLFIRNLLDEKYTVFILKFKGKIPVSILEWFESFLNTETRKRISLAYPPISLDLRYILPICICDKYNMNALNPLLDWIHVSDISKEEKKSIIYNLIIEKEKLYSLKSVAIQDDAAKMLHKFSINIIESILDEVLMNQKETYEKITITCEMLHPYLMSKAEQKASFGFGGILYENN